MANYSVDIEIGVKGAQRLTKFRKEINRTAKEVDGLNQQIRRAAGNKFENSIDRLNASVSKTSGILNRAAIGTSSFTKAAQLFVKAEREREIALQKTQKTLENARRSQLGMQTLEQREHQLLMRGNKLRELRAEKERRLEKTRKRSKIIMSAGIGGGFPLLFGGGIAGSLAGGLGGGIGEAVSQRFGSGGGGFAGSIVATALVKMATDFANGITEVGKAMNESSKEFDRVQNILGKKGADKISAFATETELLTKTFGDFFLNVQSGVAGLINMSGILSGMIARMQRGIAERQVKRSTEFKQRVQGLRGQGGQGAKKRNILSEMTDVQFEKNVQGAANLQADQSFELIEKELQGLERKLELDAADNHAMAEAIKLRHQQVDIIEKLKAAGAVLSEQDKERIGDLLRDNQLLEDKKDLELFFKENAKEMRSIEDQDAKNLEDTLKKLEKLDESANATTENMRKQNELNLVKLTGTEYEIALKEQLLSLNKEELARFDEEKFKIEFNNKLRIDGLMKQKQITEDIKNLLATEMSTAIKGLITGANTLNDAFRSILNKMADAFLNIGLFGNAAGTLTKDSGLLGNLFGGLLANGGPAKAGKSYIVGEQGPELFTPGVSGMVSPNSSLGGSTNIVVNVDASGSNVEGDEEGSEQLGRAFSDAIQLELVKQQRPGGLLYR